MKSQKLLFNLKENIHYLNCAYKAPLLKSAEKACMQALIRSRNPVEIQTEDFFNQTEEIQVQFARIIGDQAENIALIPSTSYGFSAVLSNIRGKKGGHALTNFNEFPSGYYCLKKWCDNNQQDLIVASPKHQNSPSKNWNENILNSITKDTSIVLMSSIHWMNGFRFDLEAIGKKCEAVGAVFIVDGTQSVGALPMDVHKYGIDVLVCATYKWLFGPYSMALAYINEKFHQGIPLEEAWMNRSNARNFQSLTNYVETYRPNAARYNVGETSNFILSPILLEALKQINQWQPQHIQQYCKKLRQPLIDYLNQIDVGQQQHEDYTNHLFSLNLPPNIPIDLFKEQLAAHQVYISLRGQSIRVSINVFNEEQDIQQLIKVIDRCIHPKQS